MHILILLLWLVALPGLTIAYAYHSGYLGYVIVRAMAYGCRSTLPGAPVSRNALGGVPLVSRNALDGVRVVPQRVGSVKVNQVTAAPAQV